MRTVVRGPRRTKATLSFVAAVAVLLGGASTFARWADETQLIATGVGEKKIQTGDWDMRTEPLTITGEKWFDTHPKVVTSGNYQSTANAFRDLTYDGSNPLTKQGDKRTYGGTVYAEFGPTAMRSGVSTPFNATDVKLVTGKGVPTAVTDNIAVNGQEVTLGDVRFVPGDSLLGVYTVDYDPADVVSKLNADHLRVKVSGVTVDNVGFDFAISIGTQGDIITWTAFDSSDLSWLSDNQVAVYIDYPFNGTEAISKSDTDYNLDASDGKIVETIISQPVFTNLTVTVEQVME